MVGKVVMEIRQSPISVFGVDQPSRMCHVLIFLIPDKHDKGVAFKRFKSLALGDCLRHCMTRGLAEHTRSSSASPELPNRSKCGDLD